MKRIIFYTCLFTVFTVAAFSQTDLQTVATVNLTGKTESITVRQLRLEIEKFEKAAGRSLDRDERRKVLDTMIDERLALQAAERDKIVVFDNEVNSQINQLREQMAQAIGRPPTDTEFWAAVRSETGLEQAAYREHMKRQLTIQKFLMTKKEDTFKNIRVPTEREITDWYDLNRTRFVRPDTVRFSMIQVPYGENATSKTRAKELVDRLAREIGTSPARFDEVVLRGQAPNSGYQAGDGGYLPRNQEAAQVVGQEFIGIAFNLKQGEVSKVIEGRLGYQIIKVTETYSMKSLELDDIFQLGTRATVRDFVGNGILQERQMETLQKASEELVAELRAGRSFRVIEQNLNW